ncbi:hypothetical protein MID00_16525 [Alcaligenes sp. NLF5-7]|uniref:hypothetical protein n=1 Tax=Alcaligenes sp. NLF5-7 TaxID=2918755 RepID=UPI0020C29603|nr:hypothetical protein [Alcaligenes sp. NLF5-7]UTM01083.1 hypothetical protein MID00_16525 [Alcaligenes sp. NLF5-7]
MRTIINIVGLGGVVLLALAGCGDAQERNVDPDVVMESAVKDEDRVMREAAENRKRFMGDGKAKYTPQPVEGF